MNKFEVNKNSSFYKEDEQRVFLTKPYTNYPAILIGKRDEHSTNEHIYFRNRFHLVNEVCSNKDLNQKLKDVNYVNSLLKGKEDIDLKNLSKIEFQLIHETFQTNLKFILLTFLNKFDEEISNNNFLSYYLENKDFLNKINSFFNKELNGEIQKSKIDKFLKVIGSLKEVFFEEVYLNRIENNLKKVLLEIALINKISNYDSKQEQIDNFVKRINVNKQGWIEIKNKLESVNKELEIKVEVFIREFKEFIEYKEGIERKNLREENRNESNSFFSEFNNLDFKFDILNSINLTNGFERIGDYTKSIGSSTMDIAESVGEVAGDVLGGIGDAIGSSAESVGEVAGDILGGIGDAIGSIVD